MDTWSLHFLRKILSDLDKKWRRPAFGCELLLARAFLVISLKFFLGEKKKIVFCLLVSFFCFLRQERALGSKVWEAGEEGRGKCRGSWMPGVSARSAPEGCKDLPVDALWWAGRTAQARNIIRAVGTMRHRSHVFKGARSCTFTQAQVCARWLNHLLGVENSMRLIIQMSSPTTAQSLQEWMGSPGDATLRLSWELSENASGPLAPSQW